MARRSGRARGAVVGQHAVPPGTVGVAPARSARAEPLPPAVLDVHARRRVALVDEGELDLGGVGAVGAYVPEVGEAMGRLPHGDLAPVDLDAGGGALEDPAAWPRLEDDSETWLSRHRVRSRP